MILGAAAGTRPIREGPAHRYLYAILEGVSRPPAKPCGDLAGIDQVATIMDHTSMGDTLGSRLVAQ